VIQKLHVAVLVLFGISASAILGRFFIIARPNAAIVPRPMSGAK